MRNYYIAQIKWLSNTEGGRKKIPPKGTRYCPLIRIYNKVNYEEWSIDFMCPDFTKTNIINFNFLAKDVSHNLIEKDKSYEIYEGNKRVAEIKIVDKYLGEHL